MIATDYIVGDYYQCPNCILECVELNDNCCAKPDYIPVRYYEDEIEAQIGDDNYLIYNQCQNCGRKKGTALKKKDHPKQSTPTFDYHLNEKRKELSTEFFQIKQRLDKEIRTQKNILFRNNYNDYMLSREWEEKRKLVLERDNNICQKCKEKPAEQVHHLTYDNFRNEKLEDLMSVCVSCHEKIHNVQ